MPSQITEFGSRSTDSSTVLAATGDGVVADESVHLSKLDQDQAVDHAVNFRDVLSCL